MRETGTLSLVLPVAASAAKLLLDDATYKGIEKQLDFGRKSLDSVLKGGLVRVQNKRQEFLWVHPRFEGEY